MGVRPVSLPGVELEPVFNRIGKATQRLRHLGGSLLMQASRGLSLRLGPGQSVSSQDLGLCRELCASNPGVVVGLEHVSGLLESRVGCPLRGGAGWTVPGGGCGLSTPGLLCLGQRSRLGCDSLCVW